MSRAELSHTFGVSDHDNVPEYQVFWPDDIPEKIESITLHAWDEPYLMRVRPNDLLVAEDVVSVVREGNKSALSVGRLPTESNCHYSGELISHQRQPVALSRCQHLVSGHFL